MMTASTISARGVSVQLGSGIGTSSFVGVSLTNASVGMMLLEDTQGGGSFIGLRAAAERAGVDGIDGLTLEGGQLSLALNTGPSAGELAGRVVDFTRGDLDADGKLDGATPVRLRGNTVGNLDFKTSRLEAGGRLVIALSDPAAEAGAQPILNASGHVVFRQSGGTVQLAGSELNATVNVAGQRFGIVDGTLGLVLPGEGFALDLTATAALPVPGLNNVTLYGDVSLALNRTGRVIDEAIAVGSGSVNVRFDEATDATRFSLSNLDASLDGVLGETLVDLSSGLVTIREQLEAGEKLPVVDKTLDDMLNLSPVISLGDYIQNYVNGYRDTAWQSPLGLAKPTYGGLGIPTIAGLKSYLDQNWAPKAGVSAGLDFALDQNGLAFGFQGKVRLGTDLLPIELDAGFEAIGLKFDARLDVQAQFEADLDLDFALNWSDGFKATFDLNKLGFQGSLSAQDVVLAATLGPVDVSIGKSGKDSSGNDFLRGSLQADIGGSISFVDGEFKLAPGTNQISVDLPVYASVAGIDLSEGATTVPRVRVSGDPFAGTLQVTTEGMEALTNFSKIRIEDVLFALPDMLNYLETVDLDQLGLSQIPFLDTALSEVINVADVFKTEVVDKIDFYRPIKHWVALPGESGSAKGTGRVEAGGNQLIGTPGQFAQSMAGYSITIAGAQRPVIEVSEDGSTLMLGGSFRQASDALSYEIHKKRERIRTMGEFVDALNRSGLLGDKKATFSPLTQELVVPLTLGATLTPLELPINLALGSGDLSLSTTATASLELGVGSTLDLVLSLGGDAPELAIDNFKLDASVAALVEDLAVNAQLGFLGMTAGGEGTGSGLKIAGKASLALDRTPDAAGGARFGLDQLLTEGLSSLQFELTGDAYARMRDLTLKTGGGAGFNIGRGLELGVYVPDFSNIGGFKLVFDSGFDIADPADLDEHGLTGKEIVAVVPDLGSILDVSRLTFADIIGGIRMVGDVIEEAIGDQAFYTEKIPLIDRSLAEMLAFGDNFLARIEAAGATPAGALDEAERLIEEALGLDPSVLDLSIDNDRKLLRIDFNYVLEFAEDFNLKLDLATLLSLAGEGIDLPPSLMELFDVTGAAAGRLSAGLVLSAGVGIALPGAAPGTPFVQLLDHDAATGKGTRLDLTASVQANGVTLKLRAGQVEAGIFDGTIVLDEDADIETLAPAALRVALKDGKPEVSAVGAFDIDLPIKLVLKGKQIPIGDLSVYTDPALGSRGVQTLFEQIAGLSTETTPALKVDLPDFERLLSTDNALLKMLYDPTPVLDGIDLGLGELQSLFEATLDVDLPFIGNGLAEVGTMIGDLRGGLLLDLRESLLGDDGLPVPGKPVEILQKTLFDAFNGLGILQDTNQDGRVSEADVDIGFYDVTGKRLMTWVKGMPFPKGPVDAIRFDMDLGGRILGGGLDIPLDLDLPGFELEVDGGFALDISWAFDFAFGLSTQEGFYLGVNDDEATPELRLDLGLFLDGDASDPDKITAFEGRGKLLFFEAGLKDIDRNPNMPGHQPSGLTGRLALDVVGDEAGRLTLGKVLSDGLSVLKPSFVVDADLKLGLFLAAAGLPKLEADFVFDWGWSLADPGKVEIPRINIENLRLDLKSTVLDWLLPIADKVAKGVAPFKDIVDALVTPIPGLEQVVKDDPTLRGVISKVVALQDPKAPPIDWSFLDAVRFALEMPEAVRQLAAIGSGMPLGSLYNLGRPDFRFAAATLGTGPDSDSSVLDKLRVEVSDLNKKSSGGVTASASATERSGLVFLPYILDIGNWAKMFSGGNATLFTYELPLLNFGVNFDVQLARIPVPIPPVSWIQIVIGAFGSAKGYVDLAFGFDTYGIQKFMETDNLLDVFDGFYISDYSLPLVRNGAFVPNTGGKEKPEFGIDLELGLTGGVSLGGVAELGLGGSITVDIDADLNDIRYANIKRDADGQVTLAEFTGDGKIRASELLTMLLYENLGPLNLFNLDAELGVTGSVYGKVGIRPFQISAQAQLFKLKLLELSYDAPIIQPRFGSVSNGVLTLFSGPRAADRMYIDTVDAGETWKLSGSGGTVQVEFAGKFYREFSDVERIEIDLGEGNDSFDASRLSDVVVFAKGGGGDDTIVLGKAGGMAFDEEGHNTLKAVESSDAPVTLIGGAGNDTLTGGAGDDLLIAGPGSNTLSGGRGNDSLFALEGGNRLTGGEGIDRYVFIGTLGANRMIEKGDEPSILDFSGVIPAELAAFTGPVVGAPTVSIPAGFTATRGGPAQLLFRGTPFAFDGPADRQLTVTLSAPDGTIAAESSDGVTVGGNGAERTFIGTVSNLNAFFTTPGRVTYTYASQEASRPLSVQVAYGAFMNTAQATITASLTLDQTRGWRDVAVAGSRQVAVASPTSALFASTPGGIWLSNDGGATWTESAAPKDRQYSAVALSSDGARIVAAVLGGGLLASSDGGQTWADAGAPADAYTDVMILTDGRVIATDRAIREQYVNSPTDRGWRNTSGVLVMSDPQGANWRSLTGLPNANWSDVAASADGRILLAVSGPAEFGTTPASVWIGRSGPDASAPTWTNAMTGLPANANWSAVAVDPSGSRAYVANRSGTIYSADLSAPTVRWQSTGLAARDWNSLAFSADGQDLVASASGLGKSGLWLLQDAIDAPSVVSVLGSSNRFPGAESPAAAIDGSRFTKYLNHDKAGSGLVLTLDEAAVVEQLALTSAGDSPERDPVEVSIYGSNSDTAWGSSAWTPVALNVQTGLTTARGVTQIASFANGSAYQHYKVVFTQLRDASKANSVQVAEVDLFPLKGWRPIDTAGLMPLDLLGFPIDLEWTAATFNSAGDSIVAVAAGNRVFSVPIPTQYAAPAISLPASLEVNPGTKSELAFAPDTLVDADSPSLTLSLRLSDPSAGTLALDMVAAGVAGLQVGGDGSEPTLNGSAGAISTFLEKVGAVSVSLGLGAKDIALELVASDGLERTEARLPLAATQPLAIKSNYNGGSLEIIDLRGNDLRLNRFLLSNTTLGPLNDELSIQRLPATPLVVTASGGPDRYVFDAGNTESDSIRSLELRDTDARDITNDALVMRMKSMQFSTTGNVLQLGAGEVISGVERVQWDEGLGELVVIGDVVTLKPLEGQPQVNLGQTRLRVEAERLVVEGTIQARAITLNVSGLVELNGELLDGAGQAIDLGAVRAARPVEVSAGTVDLGALVTAAGGAGLQIVPSDPATPIKLGAAPALSARSLGGGSINLDPARLGDARPPVLVIGASGGANPIALGGGGSVLALQTDLVVMAQGDGGRIEVGGQLSGQKLEIYGPGNTTVFESGSTVVMSNSILIDDSVRFDGTVTLSAGEGALSAEDLTVTGRINGGLGAQDEISLRSNGGVVQVSGRVGHGIGEIELVSGGTSYVDGTYTDVDLIGGSGAGATATVEVSGGAVVSVELHGTGAGYRVGDSVRIARSSLGDLTGRAQGFSARVTAVNALEKLSVVGARDVIFDEKVVVDGDLVIHATGSVQFLDEVRITGGGRLIIEGAAELIINNGMAFEAAAAGQPAGGLDFDGLQAGSTVSFPAGIASGDTNRVTITGVTSLDLASASQVPRFDLSLTGGTMSFEAPIGQPQMVLDLGRLDLASNGSDLIVSVASDVMVNSLKALEGGSAALESTVGTITLAEDAIVSGRDVTLTARSGALLARGDARVSGDHLTIRVGQGVATEASPLRTQIGTLDVDTESGDIFIDELDSVTLVGAGARIASGSGQVSLTAANDILMQSPAGISSAGGPVLLRAGGDVGLSQIDAKAGAIQVDSGGRIFDNTDGGGQTHLKTTSTLTLNAVSGVGGYGNAQLRLDAGAVNLYNASSGDVVITGERGIRAGSSGIRSDAPQGGLAVFSVTGRVESGGIRAASGKLVMVSGKSGLTEKETAGVLALVSMGSEVASPSTSSSSSAGSASAVAGLRGSQGSAGAPVSSAQALSSAPPTLSSSASSLSSVNTGVGGGSAVADTPASGAVAASEVVIAGRTVANGESATSALTAAASGGSGGTPAQSGQGVVSISSAVSSASQVGSITTIGRTTSLMLDVALKAIETSNRPTFTGASTLSELMNRTPAMRSEASLRTRDGEAAPAAAPAQPAGPVPAPAPAQPAGSGVTGSPGQGSGASGSSEGGAGAATGPGQAGGQASPATEGPRSMLPGLSEPHVAPVGIWARLAGWLNREASAADRPADRLEQSSRQALPQQATDQARASEDMVVSKPAGGAADASPAQSAASTTHPSSISG
jgi:hypothetical protein